MTFSLILKEIIGIFNVYWWSFVGIYIEQPTCGSFPCGGPFRCGALGSEIECQARARLDWRW
jgi:hypothetical protein